MVLMKRFAVITLFSVLGYFLFLHAAVASDSDDQLKWYYRLEMIIAGIIWFPAVTYLKFRELINFPTNTLGFWVLQYFVYWVAFRLRDTVFSKT